jgi:hypothetical protein
MLVKPLLYRLNPVLQVLNRLMLKDILDNIFAGKAFEPKGGKIPRFFS